MWLFLIVPIVGHRPLSAACWTWCRPALCALGAAQRAIVADKPRGSAAADGNWGRLVRRCVLVGVPARFKTISDQHWWFQLRSNSNLLAHKYHGHGSAVIAKQYLVIEKTISVRSNTYLRRVYNTVFFKWWFLNGTIKHRFVFTTLGFFTSLKHICKVPPGPLKIKGPVFYSPWLGEARKSFLWLLAMILWP